MIPRKFKYALTLTMLALASACLISGCKKKHDKIDLSGSETTEAAVQTAPASTAASKSETEANINIEPGIENAQSEGTSAGGSADAFSLSVKTETYKNNNVSIQYPVVSDSSIKSSVNDHLKENALSILKGWQVDESVDTLDVTCKILSATKNRITVRYEGSYMVSGGAHPSSVFYTNTVNLGSGADISLSDLADPATLASYVMSDSCTFPEADEEIATEAKRFLKEENKDYFIKLFQNADFPYKENFPECFSYEYEGTIYISLPVPHAIGDSILVAYTPENK